ncbi:hypothetical protein BCV72DRAFT_243764 [Rhizopus microsporus var. microsporus]|uniref:MULE transposase domain-containing protein n=1 Tax=Rhizopus microsporus var. microsporus TaxID=86635 RepID=A0A1X0QWW8_RHIZD|nr:hypothetical protein BCV72DRAFT_243764 [Rhizopus microsporus var. microsporus]
MEHEKIENYLWALQMFKNSVAPDALIANTSLELPNVFVTDNESALRRAIAMVFPSSDTLLCYLHLLRNVQNYALQNFTKNYSNENDRKIVKLRTKKLFYELAFKCKDEISKNSAVDAFNAYFSQDEVDLWAAEKDV